MVHYLDCAFFYAIGSYDFINVAIKEEVFLFDVSLRKSRADSSRQEVKSGNKISSL